MKHQKSEAENMIVWIDGVNGVGKSHIAEKLAKLLTNKNAEYVESDLYWMDFIQNDFPKALSGFEPYCNKYFLGKLREVLEEKLNNFGKMPIVSVSLADKLCQKELLNYFEDKKISMLHIILEAEKETIISRIENDPFRDENAQNHQKSKVPWQMQYLKAEYPDAVRISTENKTLDEIASEIMAVLQI